MVPDILTNIAAFIVAISVLVAVHEFGHFIVGRWCGMKVLRFSIGFGKPIWTRVSGKDGTEYCIARWPLGGYVKFLDGRDSEIAPEDEGRAFNQRPVAARIAVLFAGPAFNFLFAILAYVALFTSGVPTMKPVLGEIAQESYAAEAGLRFGDRIVSVDGKTTDDWESALVAMLDSLVDEGRIELEVIGEDGSGLQKVIVVPGDVARLRETGYLFEGLGISVWEPRAVIATLSEGGAAEAAGLEIGDRITRIDNAPVGSFYKLRQLVAERPDMNVDIELLRDNQLLTYRVRLQSVETETRLAGVLGIGIDSDLSEYWYLRQYGPVEALGQGIASTWSLTRFTVSMLASMVTGDVSSKNISGPINIAQFAGDSASAGLSVFLDFLIKISISLGIINLLPVPMLDGGQIIYQSIEGIKGSPLSDKIQLIGQQLGILALLLLMTFAFYNDIARLIG